MLMRVLRRLPAVAMLALVLTSCQSVGEIFGGGADAMDWELFRGDESLSGYTRRSLPERPTLKWSHKSGVRTMYDIQLAITQACKDIPKYQSNRNKNLFHGIV